MAIRHTLSLVLVFVSVASFAHEYVSIFGGKSFSLDRAVTLINLPEDAARMKQIENWGVKIIFGDFGNPGGWKDLNGLPLGEADSRRVTDVFKGSQEQLNESPARAIHFENTVGAVMPDGEISETPFGGQPYIVLNTTSPLNTATLIHEYLHNERSRREFPSEVLQQAGADAELWRNTPLRAQTLSNVKKALAQIKLPEGGMRFDTGEQVISQMALLEIWTYAIHYIKVEKYLCAVDEFDVYAATLEAFALAGKPLATGESMLGMAIHSALLKKSYSIESKVAEIVNDHAELMSPTLKTHVEALFFYQKSASALEMSFLRYLNAVPERKAALRQEYLKLKDKKTGS